MNAEKAYKWFAPLQVLIACVYLFVFLRVGTRAHQPWENMIGIFFLPFAFASLVLGIVGISLIFKARKESRSAASLYWAMIGHFSGVIVLVVVIVLTLLALFNILVFQGWLSS